MSDLGCVLRAIGVEFAPALFLVASPLRAETVFRQGDVRWTGATEPATHRASGFNAAVSAAGLGDVDGQVEDALRFLAEHEGELRRLGAFPGVEEVCLDFSVAAGPGARSTIFPAELLWRTGALDIDLVVTVHATASAAAPGEHPQ